MRRKILIWGKTYPNLSESHRETVCTGGCLADTGAPVRLYPIKLRYLPELQQFSLYDVVSMAVRPSTSDPRPESMKLAHPRIDPEYHVPTDAGWIQRYRIIFRDKSWHYPCLAKLHEARERDSSSLGFIKVRALDSVEAEDRPDEDRGAHERKLRRLKAQPDLLEGETKDLEFFPYRIRVRWRCSDLECPGHHAQVLDWGLGQLARKAGIAKAIDKMKSLGDLDRLDLAFFVGNYKQHPQHFGVVALWYPPRQKLRQALEQSDLL